MYTFGSSGIELNEALWTYLLPLLERLKTATGTEIDLYSVADFAGGDLEILKQYVKEAIIRLKAEEVTVLVVDLGEEISPSGSKKLLCDFNRDEAADCLKQILVLIEQATVQKMAVRFKGQ